VPSAISSLLNLLYEYNPDFLNFNVPAIFIDEF